MTMSDPVADMFARMKNAGMVRKKEVNMPFSSMKLAIAKLLKEEGYINNVEEVAVDDKPGLKIDLKYFHGRHVIDQLDRVSRPGLRIYKKRDELPLIKNGLGIA